MMARLSLRLLAVMVISLSLGACVNQSIKSTSVPSVKGASTAVDEHLLLDVGIAVFDPGLEDYDEDERVYPEVRKAEARFMPLKLAPGARCG